MAKILILIEASRFSGPAKVVVETLNKLRSEHECTFIGFVRGDDESNEYIDSIRNFDYPLQIVREKFRYDPRALIQLRSIIEKIRPDIIEAHNFKSSAFLILLHRVNPGIFNRVIHYYHGEVQADLKQTFYNWFYRQVLRGAKEIVVVSARQREFLSARGVDAEKITIIRNGIENFAGSVDRESPIPRVISVGRLSFEKGHDLLLRAIAEIRARKKSAPFVVTIIGEGPQNTSLQKLSAELHLQDIVSFKGYSPDTRELYQNADILALPSRSEGIPMVILEAALHGVAIVSFDIGGVREVLPNETSIILVDPENIAKLADGIERLLAAPALRRQIASEAMKIVKKDFSAERRVSAVNALYRQTPVNGRSKP